MHAFIHLSHSSRSHSSLNRVTEPLSRPQIIFAIILPPLGVFLERGCTADLFINILLTILGFIPGIIHALYIILKY